MSGREAVGGLDAAFEAEARARGLVDDAHLGYEEWLAETGLDDSFVGMPEDGVPGTRDLYEAAVRVHGPSPAPGR